MRALSVLVAMVGLFPSGTGRAAPLLDAPPPFPPAQVQPWVSPGVVEQVGEIVVMEGDAEIVTTVGADVYQVDQLENITNRLYLNYGDEFDGIAVFTTFPDAAQSGAAYAMILDNGVSGLNRVGASSAPYGSSGRLIAVMNINDTDNYASMEADDQWFATVITHELGHTWLAFIEFVDPTSGLTSTELLGRDGSHWSAVFASGSSVMDGVGFTDNGDGTFTAGPYSRHYGPLDLYAMGVFSPAEVGPLYIIRNPRYQDNNDPVNPVDDGWTGVMSDGRVVVGDRTDFTIDDVVVAQGPRLPAWDEANEDFRIAIVLVTQPGQAVADVADRIDKLERGRISFEDKHREWPFGRSSICTDVSAPCPLAFARVDSVLIGEDDADSDGDGVIEPGEQVAADVTFLNDGAEAAVDVVVELRSEAPGLLLPEPQTLATIARGERLEHRLSFAIEGEACGEEIVIEVRATIASRSWTASASFRPGVVEGARESFATDAGWQANALGSDSAISGAWAHAVPEATYFAGRTLQPDGGADGAGDPAWFTGPVEAWDEGEVTGATSLTSALYDLSDRHAPMLRYKVWYLALDRPALGVAADAHLIVEASPDGGASWREVERVGGEPLRWQSREVALGDGFAGSAEVLLRFTAFDEADADGRLVEVGIDDVTLVSLSSACQPGGGGGGCCNAATGSGQRGLGLLLLATLVVLRRRRQR